LYGLPTDYIPIAHSNSITFDHIKVNESKAIFWNKIGHALRRNNERHFQNHISISSSDDFINLFSQNLWDDTKIVIFVDEFDKLYNATNGIRDNCLETFQSIRNSNTSAICSIVAIGTLSIEYLSPQNLCVSPFNRESLIDPFFSKQQVHALFKEFEEMENIQIDDEIVDEIYIQTSGYVKQDY